MRFLLTFFLFLFHSFSVFCGESDSLMSFSTIGPDYYKDGTIVLDNEYYALVWQSKNIEDISFSLCGESSDTNTAVVLRALPRAKDGHCLMTTFSVNKDSLPKITNAGILKMYLLDTRIYENGIPKVGGLKSVQSSVPITKGQNISTKSISGEILGSFKSSLLPSYIGNPIITGISITNSSVYLTVKNTFDNVNYVVSDPIIREIYGNSDVITGKTGYDIVFLIPYDNKKTALFKVNRLEKTLDKQ